MPACKIYELSFNTSTLVASSRSKGGIPSPAKFFDFCVSKNGAQLLIKAEISKVRYISCKLSTSKLCFYHFQCFFFFLVCLFCFPFFSKQAEDMFAKRSTSLSQEQFCINSNFSAGNTQVLWCLPCKGKWQGCGAPLITFSVVTLKIFHKFFDSLLLIGGMYSHFPRILSGFSASFLFFFFNKNQVLVNFIFFLPPGSWLPYNHFISWQSKQ